MTPASQQKPDALGKSSLLQRLLWFAALWLGGVASVTLVSYVLRLWIAPK